MKIRIREEVSYALLNHLPVVALESTIISHGMPYPKNVEIALEVEEVIRSNGAIPATIALVGGEIVVGLSEEEIEELGKRTDVIKVSRRDLSYVVANEKWGATTVAATMIIARKAGIKVFVTGGIGGVHRGVEESLDISSDLDELARTNVAVICAGPKAILDIARTLEYLETKGVPVLGYKTNKLPLFYSLSDKYPVLYQVNSANELAKIIVSHNALDLGSGILITNPIPKQFALPYEEIDEVIQKAISDMKQKGIRGKEETPFLLARISELTKGRSLQANRALILNNAELGAKVAKAIMREENENKG